MSLRKTLIVGVVGVVVFGFTAMPVSATGNIFQQVQQSITGQFERLYLQVIPGDKPGKLVLKQVGVASQNLKSFDGKTTVLVEAKGAAGSSLGAATLTVSGPTVIGEVWDTKTYKQDLSMTGSLTFQGKSYDAAANVRTVGGVTYLQVTKLPDLSGASLMDLQNTWVKFESTTATGAASTQSLKPDQQTKLQDAFYKMLNASEVSPAKVEQKDGNEVYVLTAMISKPAVTEYLSTLRQTNTEDMLDNFGDIKATLWVDKSSFFPMHMELPLTVDVKNAAAGQGAMIAFANPLPINTVESVNLTITSDLSKHNQSFTIVAPVGAEDSQLFFTKMMGMFIPSLTGMGGAGMMVPRTGTTLPNGYRMPTIGTTELPTMSAEQLKALQHYEELMKDLPTLGQ